MFSPAQPAPQLSRFIRSYVQIRAQVTEAMLLWPIPARSFTCMEFTFGEPYRIHYLDGCPSENTYPSIVIGAKTYQRIRLQLQGHVETFAILFHPTGLQQLFSLPGAEIVNNHYEAHSVLGPAMSTLRSQLGNADSLGERVRIVDEFFKTRIPGSYQCTSVEWAAREIIGKQGRVRVQDIAGNTTLSLRQFERRFIHELGVTPKLYARIARFEAAVEKSMTLPRRTWTEIAHELGYHDQMHMIHDFHLLSGESPTSLLSQIEHLVVATGAHQE